MVPILSYPKLLGIIAILASCYGAYYYISNMQKSLEEYKTKTIQLEQTVDNYKNQIKKAVEIQKTLNVELQETRNQTRLLEKKLEENNLKDITTKKPSLVENIVNSATQKSNRCFELLSGSTLTDAERNAKSANEFNSECPWLYDELVTSK